MARLLRYIVSHTLSGHLNELKEYSIGSELFERGPAYDPRTDPVVRVEVRRLRSKLTEYYFDEGRDDEMVVSIPKGSYVAQFETRPAPASVDKPLPAAVTATENPVAVPALQANGPTPLSLAEPPIAAPLPHQSLWSRSPATVLVIGVILGAAIAGAVAAFLYFRTEPLSMAVLPFSNLSPDPANKYFSDGLTDEITGELSQLKGVRVVARSSASQFGANQDLQEIGRKLHVNAVLEGSVERYGDRIKVIAELERVSDGTRIWSNTFERQLSDLFAVQSEVATGIATSLRASITPPPPAKHVPDQEAYNDYLKGIYEARILSADSLDRARQLFQDAIERDPLYGPAYCQLASVLLNQSEANFQTPIRKRVELLYRKAIELDPSLASAHEGLGLLTMRYDWDWTGAAHDFEVSNSLAPNAPAEIGLAFLAVIQHRFREADDHSRRAVQLDPLGSATLMDSALIDLLEKRFDESRTQLHIIESQTPNFLLAPILDSGLYVYQGHPEKAIEDIRPLAAKFPPARMVEVMALARAGKRDQSLKLLRPFEQNFDAATIPAYWIALEYGLLGDRQKTTEWLTRSADAREFQALYIAVEPDFDSVRDYPAFRALQKRMGL